MDTLTQSKEDDIFYGPPAQTKHIIEAYQKNPNRDTVEMLADELQKSVKSIIGKLSREGVYRS